MPDTLPPPSLASEPALNWSARVERISLQRAPASPQAHQLTLELATLIEPLLGRDRQLGTAGRRAHQNQVGVILAGLLKAGLRGQKVRAQRGKARPWTASAVGQDVFWRKVEAMERAGRVRIYAGIGFFRAGRITGKAAAIECTMALLGLAGNAGLSADTFAADSP